MRYKIILCVVLQSMWNRISADTCSLPEHGRVDCGWAGIRRQTCTNIGCCFQIPQGNSPWCYYPSDFPFPMVPRLNPRDAGLLTGEPDECRAVNYASRDNCGYPRITSSACQSRGCCFDSEQQRFAWCFYPRGYFNSDGKAIQKFSGTALLSRVFESSLGENSSSSFHSYAPVVDWQLLKSMRYKVPSVKSVYVHAFTEQNGYTQSHFIVETISPPSDPISLQQLTDSSVDAIRTRLIGIVDYTMFINIPVLKDYNECQTTRCPKNSNCINTMGSFTCSCKEGYTGDGVTQCDDVNECDVSTHGCHDDATCVNSEGSYVCTCDAGFTGDGRNSCQALTDVSTDPVWVCDPVKGYTPVYGDFPTDGVQCSSDASCEFDDGKFTCDCNDGFEGDGKDCDDVDECDADNHQCDVRASCYNEEGGYGCSCDPGLTGDGFSCDDVNECDDIDVCDVNSTCKNSFGDYECNCHLGFVENGDDDKSCQEQIILYGEIPIVGAVTQLLDPGSPFFPSMIDFLEDQLEIFYSQLLQPDVDVEFVKLENNATVVGHVIVVTGNSSHDVTAASFTASVVEALVRRRNDSSGKPTVLAAPFVSLQVIKPDNFKKFISQLPDSSELEEELKEQLEELDSDEIYGATAIAYIRVNPAAIKDNSTDFLKTDASKDFLVQLEEDLYLAYSKFNPQVKAVEIIELRPDGRFDASNDSTVGIGKKFRVDFEANLTLNNNVAVPDPGSLNYSVLFSSLEAELRNSYSLLLNLVFRKIDRDTNPDAGKDENRDEDGSGDGSGSGSGYNDDNKDNNEKKRELPSSFVEVRITNLTQSTSGRSTSVQHVVSFKFPPASKLCKEVLLTALTSITSSNTTDISLVFDSSPAILRSLSSSQFPASCNATVLQTAMLWELTSDDVRLLYGISRLLIPQNSQFASMPANVVLTRRPMVVDLVQFLYRETNETWREQNEPKCASTCLTAKHVVQVESKDKPILEMILRSFLKSVTENGFKFSSQSFLGIPFDVEIIDPALTKNALKEKQKEIEGKTFTALVDLTSSNIANLIRTLSKESVTYKAILVFLETNLETVYKHGLTADKPEPDMNNLKVEISELRIVVNESNASQSVSLLHTVTVFGGNLTLFGADELVLLFSVGASGMETNMFSRNLRNATLLSYKKTQKTICDPSLGWTQGSVDVEGCSEDAECVRNSSSLFQCTCEDGYQGDGYDCSDVDECDEDSHGCSVFAECENEKGGYDCECKKDFAGDGFSCDDVNECELERDDCHDNATCTNTFGGFECSCDDGFIGNGKLCAEQSFFYGLIQLNSSFTFLPQLSNSSSEVSNFLSDAVTASLTPMYGFESNLNITVTVTAFLEGSVFVEHIVTVTGQGAYNLEAETLNQTFVEASNAFPVQSRMFSHPLRTLDQITTDGIESVLDFRGRGDLLTEVLGVVNNTEEVRCLSAAVRINADVYEEFAAGNSCPVTPEFTAKLQRQLFDKYSRVYPNIMQMKIQSISPATELTEFSNPVARLNESLVFSGSILVRNLHNYTRNISSTENRIMQTALEAELRRAYINSVRSLLSPAETCDDSENDCSDGCKQNLLTVRLTELQNNSQAGTFTAQHIVIVQLPAATAYCRYIMNITGITYFLPTDIELVRGIDEIVAANFTELTQNCANMLQRVFDITNLTPLDLLENFTNSQTDRYIYAPPFNLTKTSSPEVSVKVLTPSMERFPISCTDMIAFHSVVYSTKTADDFNTYLGLSRVLSAFANNTDNSYTGLPFDISTQKFNASLLDNSSPTEISLAKLKFLGPPTFPLGPITKFATVPSTNGQSSHFNAFANDLKIAASFLLAARSFNIETASELLSVLDGLRSPVRSLILSLLSSPDNFALLGLDPYLGQLLVAAVELNL